MSTAPPKTRFPLPPEGPLLRFPESPPLFTCIADLSGYWIEIKCECQGMQRYPLRLMAAENGWTMTVSTMVSRLRCRKCKTKPIEVWLIERDDGDDVARPRGRRVDLTGTPRGSGPPEKSV